MRIVLRRTTQTTTGVSSTRARFWFETIALVCGIACAVALLFAALGAAAGAAAEEPESGQVGAASGAPSAVPVRLQSFEGLLTDTLCGAKHSAAMGKAPADCTRACVHGGEQFALVDGDALYLIEGDLLMLKGAAGQRVRISGTLNGKKISVASVFKT
jgi:hypothetical protein